MRLSAFDGRGVVLLERIRLSSQCPRRVGSVAVLQTNKQTLFSQNVFSQNFSTNSHRTTSQKTTSRLTQHLGRQPRRVVSQSTDGRKASRRTASVASMMELLAERLLTYLTNQREWLLWCLANSSIRTWRALSFQPLWRENSFNSLHKSLSQIEVTKRLLAECFLRHLFRETCSHMHTTEGVLNRGSTEKDYSWAASRSSSNQIWSIHFNKARSSGCFFLSFCVTCDIALA